MASSRNRKRFWFISLGLLGILACAIGPLLCHLPSGYPLIDESEARIRELRILTQQQNAFYAEHQRFASPKDLFGFGKSESRSGGFVFVVLTPQGWIGAAEPHHPLQGRAFYCTHAGDIFVSDGPLGSSNLTSYDRLSELASRSRKKVEPSHPSDG